MSPDGLYGALVAWAKEYAERIDPLTPLLREAERIATEEVGESAGTSERR